MTINKPRKYNRLTLEEFIKNFFETAPTNTDEQVWLDYYKNTINDEDPGISFNGSFPGYKGVLLVHQGFSDLISENYPFDPIILSEIIKENCPHPLDEITIYYDDDFYEARY